MHHVLIYPQGINESFIGRIERFDGFSYKVPIVSKPLMNIV